MKKTYKLTESKHKPARLVDAIRNDIRKYLKRERKKDLPGGVDFWDFDCKVGRIEKIALPVHVSALSESLGPALTENWATAYIEIIAKPGRRKKVPKSPEKKLVESKFPDTKFLEPRPAKSKLGESK